MIEACNMYHIQINYLLLNPSPSPEGISGDALPRFPWCARWMRVIDSLIMDGMPDFQFMVYLTLGNVLYLAEAAFHQKL